MYSAAHALVTTVRIRLEVLDTLYPRYNYRTVVDLRVLAHPTKSASLSARSDGVLLLYQSL